ncbi:MAG TPA: PQQ-binding-like beta-propeller repeat protein, partial [Gemmataceae bacterium]|nr:PQQ-binding-like beta-propeller repeat protein [Gemmataceae bacterium]
DLEKDFDGHCGSWGYTESPLVDGDKVLVTPGGKKNTIVALDKSNGKLIWTSPVPDGDTAGYSSIIAAEVDGQRQYIQFTSRGVVGVAAKDGKFLWRYDEPANRTANCSTPVFYKNQVFAASAYGKGGGLAKLTRTDDKTTAEQVYFTDDMQNHHGGMVLVDGYLYGSNEGQVCCLKFDTGEIMWQNKAPGKGSITCADGCLYYRNEGGKLFLFEANPKEYKQLGTFKQQDRSDHQAWAHPVIANGRMYIADQDKLFCYDVKKK